MPVTAGKEYCMIAKGTWFFESGIGDCTLLATPEYLFIYPHKTMASDSRSFTDTKFTIGGRKPAEAIADLLKDESTTALSMQEKLLEWSSQVKGPIVERLEDFKRVRIFTGFIRRSLVLSKKEKGMDVGATGLRPTKEELPAILEFFKGHPHVEIK